MVEYTEYEIRDFIHRGEGTDIEFKRFNPRNIKDVARGVAEAISSFSNTEGGTIIIGVDDDGTILGINENELRRAKKSIEQIVHDRISPTPLDYRIDFQKVYLPNEDTYLLVLYIPPDGTRLCYANNIVYTRQNENDIPYRPDQIEGFFNNRIRDEAKQDWKSIQQIERGCLPNLAFEMRIQGEIDESEFNWITAEHCDNRKDLIDNLRETLLSTDILERHRQKVRFTSPSLFQFYFATWLKAHLDNIDEYLDDDRYRGVIVTLSSILENPADLCRIIDKLLDSNNPILAVHCVTNRDKYVRLGHETKTKIRQLLAELLSPIDSHICQEIIQLFVQLTHDEDNDIWRHSIRLIGRNKVNQLTGHLLDILKDREYTDLRREEALNALVEMEATSIIDNIGELLLSAQSGDDEFRANLIEGMAKLGRDSANPYLFKIIESPYENIELRRQAAFVLGDIGSPEIISRLQSFLMECEDDEVCEIIEDVLNELASEES